VTAATDGAAPAAPQSETSGPSRPVDTVLRWQPWALAAICVLAGALNVWNITSGGYGNSFYAAAVKSMSHNFTNFLFGSFDPYGVVTVDKPPMALWPQVVSVWIFGFHGWSVLLPQVLEGVAAVFVLHRTVRRWAGEGVALLAALFFALTPITVAINRDNNPDTLLVLLLVVSAYAFTRSVEQESTRRRTGWLLWCAFFIGCAFVTKMLQAWIIVPGVALAYLVGTTGSLKRRIVDLVGAGFVLFVSSFWWTALHDWWPGNKPYMGGSTDGTAWNLIFGYNGFGRIFGEGFGHGGTGARPAGGMEIPRGAAGLLGGDTGITRMFSDQVGGQISWLLPLALLILVIVAIAGIRRLVAKLPGDPQRRAGWTLWAGWLIVTTVVFSYAQGIWHPYYTTMMAPAIAAICAAGIALLWQHYRADGAAWVLLPLAVAITAAWAFVLVSRDSTWQGWTRWAVLVSAIVAIGGLALGKLSPRQRRTVARPAIVLGLISMLLAPTVWSVATAAQRNGIGSMPSAGPPRAMFGGAGEGGRSRALPAGMQRELSGLMNEARAGGFGSSGTQLTSEQNKILNYVRQNDDGAAITLAIEGGAMVASPFILGSNDVVIGMGGFSGTDNVPSISQLQHWVSDGTLRFVLAGGGRFGTRGGAESAEQQRSAWVAQHCQIVNPSLYGGGTQTLYHCSAR
jgi:4-amino-4-deoxy-L-arabinose transferase-like glycosyltransferase